MTDQIKLDDFAVNQTQAHRVALGAMVKQHLHTDADAKQGFRSRGFEHAGQQTGFPQLAHAVRHGTLPRQHNAFTGTHLIRVGRNHHLVAGACRRRLDRLRYGTQVAHAIVDHGDGLVHDTVQSVPLVEGTVPALRGSGSSAERRARAKALNTVSAW